MTPHLPTPSLRLHLGVKADPIQYRYSYEWLFRLLAEEDVHHVQLGSFFEMYALPDDYFIGLRALGQSYGVQISTLFTSHRELGGWFRTEHPAWEKVSRRNYERLIEVGVLLGAEAVGSNAGAALRDQMHLKDAGLTRYLAHMKELMEYAHTRGLAYLTIEPMSALAEPPTLPNEICAVAEELLAHHRQHPDTTARVGYCTDVAHGYADQDGKVVWDNMQLFEATLPYVHHIHLKNTDPLFNSTFGFSTEERARGIVNVPDVRERLLANTAIIPRRELVGYLELSGPKLGRDYSDWELEGMLRESIRYLQTVFPDVPAQSDAPQRSRRLPRRCEG